MNAFPRKKPGFSLIEMLVSIAVAAAMMLFVNQVLSTSLSVIKVGTGTSEVIQNGRIFSDQLSKDIAEMINGGSGGFLFIHNEDVGSVRLLKTDPNTTTVRSDQLSFARFKGRLEPVCPSANNTMVFNELAAANSSIVRMWYGHGLITQPNGSDDGTSLGATNTANQYAARWVFARQTLFLSDGATPTTFHASDATAGSSLAGGTPGFPSGGLSPTALYHGTTDVCALGLEEVNTMLHPSGALDTTAAGNHLFTGSNRLRVNPYPDNKEFTAGAYAQTHGIFLPNISSFRVQFAGDYNADGALDTTTGTPGVGPIEWYDKDNPPATVSPTSTGGGQAFFFTRANRHLWPQLIRVRARIHDRDGVIAQPDGQLGREFEVILKIRR